MKLRHFLYGKDPATDDFLTLVESSGMMDSELKYWEARIGTLIRELRDYGVPGDFMRLFISGQSRDEWAYVRARTGGDRARFDFQAIILTSEEMDRLRWQPWALDNVLFNGNTYDKRVQDAMKRDRRSPSGRQLNPLVVDIEFNEGEIECHRLIGKQEEIVDRIVGGMGRTDAPETRWYFDESRIGEEEGRLIIRGVLDRMRGMGKKVPGFVMGLTFVRGNSLSMRVAYQNDDRFSDISLASYRKDPDSPFPFENWRDAEVEQSPAPFTERAQQSTSSIQAVQPSEVRLQTSRTGLDKWNEKQTPLASMSGETEGISTADTDPAHWPSPARSVSDTRHSSASEVSHTGAEARRAANTTAPQRTRPASPFFNIADNTFLEHLTEFLARPVPLKFTLPIVLLILVSSFSLALIWSQRAEQKYLASKREDEETKYTREDDNKGRESSRAPIDTPPTSNRNLSRKQEDDSGELINILSDNLTAQRDKAISERDKAISQVAGLSKQVTALNQKNHEIEVDLQTTKAANKCPPSAPHGDTKTTNIRDGENKKTGQQPGLNQTTVPPYRDKD